MNSSTSTLTPSAHFASSLIARASWVKKLTDAARCTESSAVLLPVVDVEGHFKGVISYEEVKNTLYDPILRDLVIAEDLTSSVDDALTTTTPLAAALEILDRHRVQSWPVIEDDRLLGMVRRTDIYALMRR